MDLKIKKIVGHYKMVSKKKQTNDRTRESDDELNLNLNSKKYFPFRNGKAGSIPISK